MLKYLLPIFVDYQLIFLMPVCKMHHAYENFRERYVNIPNAIFYVSMHHSYMDMKFICAKIKIFRLLWFLRRGFF